MADFGIDNAPPCALVIVTGGPGWSAQAQAPATLDYVRRVHAKGRIASVCTGGMILAASGILDGGAATTKREVVPPETAPLEVMRATYPQIEVREALLVDSGAVVTGGGVCLCIDTTLHLLATMLGPEVARETARILEYERAWRANRDGFARSSQITG
jgi:transcriptional regulator GlxA family with amidase domain